MTPAAEGETPVDLTAAVTTTTTTDATTEADKAALEAAYIDIAKQLVNMTDDLSLLT